MEENQWTKIVGYISQNIHGSAGPIPGSLRIIPFTSPVKITVMHDWVARSPESWLSVTAIEHNYNSLHLQLQIQMQIQQHPSHSMSKLRHTRTHLPLRSADVDPTSLQSSRIQSQSLHVQWINICFRQCKEIGICFSVGQWKLLSGRLVNSCCQSSTNHQPPNCHHLLLHSPSLTPPQDLKTYRYTLKTYQA